jgi:hypothetical protein
MKRVQVFRIVTHNSEPLQTCDIESALRDRGCRSQAGEFERWRPTVTEIEGDVVSVEKIKEKFRGKTEHAK